MWSGHCGIFLGGGWQLDKAFYIEGADQDLMYELVEILNICL